MTYTYYIYKGTNEDSLNMGGPHPKERPPTNPQKD